jgi:hypothetical protein
MRSSSGTKMNWPLVAIAFAVIGVPMGVAVIQDLGSDRDDEELLQRIGQLNDISASEEPPQLESADDIAGRWHQPAMDQAFFDEVFLGGRDDSGPALRGPLAGLDWSAAAEAPDLARWPRARVELGPARATVSFPDDGTAERVLASRWGEPVSVVGADGVSSHIWTNRDARIRVVLQQSEDGARATFSPYLPADSYIRRDGRFAFETHPVLGATPEVLAARYGSRFALDAGGETGRLECPGVEVSQPGGATCAIRFADGKAIGLTVTIDHALDSDGGPNLFAALKSALGEIHKQSGDEHGNTWIFDHGVSVMQFAGTASITVERVAR